MRTIGSGSNGGDDRVPGTWAATNINKKKILGSLDSGLLLEGHFLGPRIGRTVNFLDLEYFI